MIKLKRNKSAVNEDFKAWQQPLRLQAGDDA